MNKQSSTDPIADMLTRIRNAIKISKSEISLPHSRLKEAVAKKLVENNFLDNVRVEGETTSKLLILTINGDHAAPRISEIKRISRPGRRSYVNSREIPVVKQGRGIVIISTSKGVMSGEQAKTEHIGGELICQVY